MQGEGAGAELCLKGFLQLTEAVKGMGCSQLWAPAAKTSFAMRAVLGFANATGRLWLHPRALQRAAIPSSIPQPELREAFPKNRGAGAAGEPCMGGCGDMRGHEGTRGAPGAPESSSAGAQGSRGHGASKDLSTAPGPAPGTAKGPRLGVTDPAAATGQQRNRKRPQSQRGRSAWKGLQKP